MIIIIYCDANYLSDYWERKPHSVKSLFISAKKKKRRADIDLLTKLNFKNGSGVRWIFVVVTVVTIRLSVWDLNEDETSETSEKFNKKKYL